MHPIVIAACVQLGLQWLRGGCEAAAAAGQMEPLPPPKKASCWTSEEVRCSAALFAAAARTLRFRPCHCCLLREPHTAAALPRCSPLLSVICFVIIVSL